MRDNDTMNDTSIYHGEGWRDCASAHVQVIDYAAALAEICTTEGQRAIMSYYSKWGSPLHKDGARVLHNSRKAPIPPEMDEKVARYAPRLTALMQQSVSRMVRHQTAGGIDTSKLVRLAMPSSVSAFERDAATAFRRRSTVQAPRPLKIAIVGDVNNSIRVRHPDYMPKLGTLAHILGDAAGAAGLQAACYLARGKWEGDADNAPRHRHDKSRCILARVKGYDSRISPSTFRSIVDRFAFIAPYSWCVPSGGGSRDGTGAIDYAREIDGASFVVAIGTFYDTAKADVHISPSLSIDAMISDVEAGLRAFVAGRANAA